MLINSPSTREGEGGLGFAYVSQGGGVSWNAYFCLLRGGGGLKSPQNGLRNKRMVPYPPQVFMAVFGVGVGAFMSLHALIMVEVGGPWAGWAWWHWEG